MYRNLPDWKGVQCLGIQSAPDSEHFWRYNRRSMHMMGPEDFIILLGLLWITILGPLQHEARRGQRSHLRPAAPEPLKVIARQRFILNEICV